MRHRTRAVSLTLAPPVGLLAASAGIAYLVYRAEEMQRHMESDKAREAAAAHGRATAVHPQHPPMPRK